jgi:arabinogalactan endo-1,4-beta-galactosidase
MDAALGKNAEADSASENCPASGGNDGRPDTRWSAGDGNPGHWWKVDLGQEYYLARIEIIWEQAHAYRYRPEVSLDGQNWVALSGGIEYVAASRQTVDRVDTRARYVKITVSGGVSDAFKAGFCQLRAITGKASEFITGADVSHLQQVEDFGGRFYDRSGTEGDCLEILKDHGVNFIRLKIWNKPGPPNSDPAGYNDKQHVLKMAKRIKDMGLKLLLNFHYSDWWADPGKQIMPEEWRNLGFEELEKSLYEFTYDVIHALKAQGTLPEMVQVGNEITHGMLWDEARVSGPFDTEEQWEKLCRLLKSGLRAVRDVYGSIKTVIHIDKGGDNRLSVHFYDQLRKREVGFDLIGLSYYPIWHGSLADFESNVNDLAQRYGKGIVIVETAFPYTTENGDNTPNASTGPYTKILPEYRFTVQGQANMIQAIISVVKNIPEGKGLGFFYWEPDFIPVKGAGWKFGEGSEWDDQTMFDFTGHALWSLDIFKMHRPD